MNCLPEESGLSVLAYSAGADNEAPRSVVFRKKSNLKADVNLLHLPVFKSKSHHFTLNNFIVSPGVDGEIPRNWINGTSRIKIINLLFDAAYRLKLFKRS